MRDPLPLQETIWRVRVCKDFQSASVSFVKRVLFIEACKRKLVLNHEGFLVSRSSRVLLECFSKFFKIALMQALFGGLVCSKARGEC